MGCGSSTLAKADSSNATREGPMATSIDHESDGTFPAKPVELLAEESQLVPAALNAQPSSTASERGSEASEPSSFPHLYHSPASVSTSTLPALPGDSNRQGLPPIATFDIGGAVSPVSVICLKRLCKRTSHSQYNRRIAADYASIKLKLGKTYDLFSKHSVAPTVVSLVQRLTTIVLCVPVGENSPDTTFGSV